MKKMKKIIIVCPKCGKNIYHDNLDDGAQTINCPKSCEPFTVHNFLYRVFDNMEKSDYQGMWFYKYDNGDVRIGTSRRSIPGVILTVVLALLPFCGFSLLFLAFSGIFNEGEIIGFIVAPILALITFFIIRIILDCLFGKYEYFIGESSYFFKGIKNLGKKKFFNWNEINRIEARDRQISNRSSGDRFYRNIMLHGKKPIKTASSRGNMIRSVEYHEIDFFIAVLNYLHQQKGT